MSIEITDLDDDDDDDADYKSSSNDPIAWQRSQSSAELQQASVAIDADDDDVDDEQPDMLGQSTPAVVITFDVRDDNTTDAVATGIHATSTTEIDRDAAVACTVVRARSEPAVARLSCRSTYQTKHHQPASKAAAAAAAAAERCSKSGRVRSYLRRCRDALIGSGGSGPAASTGPSSNTSVCPITHHEPIEQRPQPAAQPLQQHRYTTSWYVDETCTLSDAEAEEDVYTDCRGGVLASAGDVDTDAEASLDDDEHDDDYDAAAAIDLTASSSSGVACQSAATTTTAAAVTDEDCGFADGDDEALQCAEPDQMSQSSADTVLDMLDSGAGAATTGGLADKLIAEPTHGDGTEQPQQQVSACKCVEH